MTDLTKFLTEAREVGARATKGPWLNQRDGYDVEIRSKDESLIIHSVNGHKAIRLCESDSDFITFARNHWDEMLDLLERQGKALDVATKEIICLCPDDSRVCSGCLALASIETILAGKGEG